MAGKFGPRSAAAELPLSTHTVQTGAAQHGNAQEARAWVDGWQRDTQSPHTQPQPASLYSYCLATTTRCWACRPPPLYPTSRNRVNAHARVVDTVRVITMRASAALDIEQSIFDVRSVLALHLGSQSLRHDIRGAGDRLGGPQLPTRSSTTRE